MAARQVTERSTPFSWCKPDGSFVESPDGIFTFLGLFMNRNNRCVCLDPILFFFSRFNRLVK